MNNSMCLSFQVKASKKNEFGQLLFAAQFSQFFKLPFVTYIYKKLLV